MGVERVLQALAGVVLVTTLGHADALHERVAVIDLGPADGGVARRQIAQAITTAGLDHVGDAADALAGEGAELDAPLLADAMDTAKRAFGELDCAHAITAATTAATIAAARQAAGLAAPELPKAWSYVLLCADRGGDVDRALLAASRLRAVGGAPDVPADLIAKYPDVDVIGGRDPVVVDITSDAKDGADVWIDHVRRGVTPLHLTLGGGSHVIAIAHGAHRGAREIDVVRGADPRVAMAIVVAAPEQKNAWSAVAKRVAGWHGKVPAPDELAWVLAHVHARVALVRYGQTIEVWGQAGKAEAPRRLGAEDGVGTLADLSRLTGLVVDRVHGWNDHAPDPDRPLMLDARDALKERAHQPTKWWVYAATAGAVIAVGLGVYLHDSAKDVQHLELHYP